MTIITKPISDKKIDKLEVPLVENDQLDDLPAKSDVEAAATIDATRFVLLRARARKISTATTLCLLLTALMVVSIGIIGGTFFYRQYVRAQMHKFYGSCNFSMGAMHVGQDLNAQPMISDSGLYPIYNQGSDRVDERFFQETFELDLENDSYEKIGVPDFQNAKHAKFIHDFNSNVTGIIDTDEGRCFVMPLNRQTVLPPRSLFDLIRKIWGGYYKVDTEVVRETMKVVTPALTDMKVVGPYIARECRDLPVYKLEKYESDDDRRIGKLLVVNLGSTYEGGIVVTDAEDTDIEQGELAEKKNKDNLDDICSTNEI